jgi:GNAT superfamily N-acetyltransferase
MGPLDHQGFPVKRRILAAIHDTEGTAMAIEIRVLGPGDEAVLAHAAPDVFDHPLDPQVTAAFLADAWHHVAVALDDGRVVGFASAVHYLHPDKPHPELWINEVGVAETHRGRGLARAILRALFDAGRAVGCREAWVLTDRSNAPALRLYAASGGVPSDQVMFSFLLDPPDPDGLHPAA